MKNFINRGAFSDDFENLRPCYHICSSEDHPIVFSNDNDYMDGMSIFGIIANSYPDIRIVTFQLMSNHLHILAFGEESRIKMMFDQISKTLQRHFLSEGRIVESLVGRAFEVTSLEAFRNVVAYINRNSMVANKNETPFSYPWGANKYYFSPEAKMRYDEQKKKMTMTKIRSLTHSRQYDDCVLYEVDNYVSPMCYCDIELGESMFWNAHNYFYKVTKNIESNKEIATMIGESSYYSDDDLYSLIASKSMSLYHEKNPSLLSNKVKMDLARMMHFDYKASNKQIARILKFDVGVIDSIFPKAE